MEIKHRLPAGLACAGRRRRRDGAAQGWLPHGSPNPGNLARLTYRGGRRFLRRRVQTDRVRGRAQLVSQYRPQLGTVGALVGRAGDSPGALHRWRPRPRGGVPWNGQAAARAQAIHSATHGHDHAAGLRSLDAAGAARRSQCGNDRFPARAPLIGLGPSAALGLLPPLSSGGARVASPSGHTTEIWVPSYQCLGTRREVWNTRSTSTTSPRTRYGIR